MARKMKRYNGEDGSQVEDAEEAANKSDEAMDIARSVGAGERNTETVTATPKAAPKPVAKAAPKPVAKTESAPAPKAAPVDVTKLSANERTKQQIEKNLTSARSGSGATDSRDVNARLRDSSIGSSVSDYIKNFKTPAQRKAQEQKASKGYASGGSVGSASRRADGIATKGKTRGKMV